VEFPPKGKLDPDREPPYNYSMEDMLRLAEIELEEMFDTDLSELEATTEEEEAK
jgi:hypothetical protein|tara:strand:- start:516 stop:677 length:162 start_codon:yes stop_codon:yes gene_type:complete